MSACSSAYRPSFLSSPLGGKKSAIVNASPSDTKPAAAVLASSNAVLAVLAAVISAGSGTSPALILSCTIFFLASQSFSLPVTASTAAAPAGMADGVVG